jgi:hypothetical protein
MRNLVTPLALTLALTFTAAAHADTASETSDVYREALWNVHTAPAANAVTAGQSVAGDIYREAAWDVREGYTNRQLATDQMEAQSAAKDAGFAAGNATGLYRIE